MTDLIMPHAHPTTQRETWLLVRPPGYFVCPACVPIVRDAHEQHGHVWPTFGPGRSAALSRDVEIRRMTDPAEVRDLVKHKLCGRCGDSATAEVG